MKSPRVLALALVPLVLAACGGTDAGADAPLVPADPPTAWESHPMGPLTLAAPADWEAFDTQPGDSADEAFALKAPGDGPGTGVHTSVTSQRLRDAAAAVDNLRSVGEASVDAQDVERADLTWPDAEAAGWLGYVATVAIGGEDVEMRYEYLVVDLDDDAQAVVAVVAPADTFDESGAHDVLASVTVG